MERAGDCHDLLELETLREGLLNFAPHVSFAHQIFGRAARGKIFQLAQFRAVTAGGFEVSVIAAQLLEVPFPVGFVVGFTGKLGPTALTANLFGLSSTTGISPSSASPLTSWAKVVFSFFVGSAG